MPHKHHGGCPAFFFVGVMPLEGSLGCIDPDFDDDAPLARRYYETYGLGGLQKSKGAHEHIASWWIDEMEREARHNVEYVREHRFYKPSWTWKTPVIECIEDNTPQWNKPLIYELTKRPFPYDDLGSDGYAPCEVCKQILVSDSYICEDCRTRMMNILARARQENSDSIQNGTLIQQEGDDNATRK